MRKLFVATGTDRDLDPHNANIKTETTTKVSHTRTSQLHVHWLTRVSFLCVIFTLFREYVNMLFNDVELLFFLS